MKELEASCEISLVFFSFYVAVLCVLIAKSSTAEGTGNSLV